MPADRLLHPRAGHGRKPTSLTDFEHRVWVTYILAADDFGVMRASAVKLQDASDALAAKKPAQVVNALERIIDSGLIAAFNHQGQRFVYQWDWQTWQKVSYPRRTDLPIPPLEELQKCDKATCALFQIHPGGKGKKFKTPSEDVLENSEGDLEGSRTTRAGAPANRLTANGDRLTAQGSEEKGVDREIGDLDVAWCAFKAAYPPNRRAAGNFEEKMFYEAVSSGKTTPAHIMAALENHIASDQWQDPSKIPNIRTWLEGQRWDVIMPAPKLAGTTSKTAGNADVLRRFVERHSAAN